MTEQMRQRDHHEIDLLLPWFINHTLSDAEHDRIQLHLAHCEECQQNVSLLATVQSTLDQITPTPIVPEPRIDNLLRHIDKHDQEPASHAWVSGVALAASIGALALAAALFFTDQKDALAPSPQFNTATSAHRTDSMDYVLAIQFEAGTETTEREQILRMLDAKNITNDNDEGAYQFVVQLPAASLADLERFSADVESIAAVRSIKVIALQLPTR